MSGTHGASGVVFYSMITLYAGSVHTESAPLISVYTVHAGAESVCTDRAGAGSDRRY